MWWLFFTVLFLSLLIIAGVLAVINNAYGKALEAYRLAKFAVDQWESLASSLNRSVCLTAEDMAEQAVNTLNISAYRQLGVMLEKAMKEVRNKTLLRKFNFTWAFRDDVFIWSVAWLKRNISGLVDWLRPSELIGAVTAIRHASFDLTYQSANEALAPLVPHGAVLRGSVWGVLYGNGTYSGTLHGSYILIDKTPLKCKEGHISVTFDATHYATLTINSTKSSVEIYEEIYVEK